MNNKQEKRCFIVTPIGSDTDPIRRHIEGIIEAAIRPALEDKYKLIVAHKIYEPGSITKQVISEIYGAELVVANLTNRNPNVMYELAFRHSLGKPAIMIAESGTNLPSDIIMERVIFYQNDAQGILELRKALEKAESEIDFSKISSPIHDVLSSINRDISILQMSQNETQPSQEVLPYILNKLNRLEDIILANRTSNISSPLILRKWAFQFSFIDASENCIDDELFEALSDTIFGISKINMRSIEFNSTKNCFTVHFSASAELTSFELSAIFKDAFFSTGFENIGEPQILNI